MAYIESVRAATSLSTGGSSASQIIEAEKIDGLSTGITKLQLPVAQKDVTQLTFDSKNSELFSVNENRFTDVNRRVVDAWLSVSLTLVESSNPNWLHLSISKAERYMMALYSNDEYRNFISSYLLILRNNSDLITNESRERKILGDSLDRYKKSSREVQDRMGFIRSLRAVGISPVGR